MEMTREEIEQLPAGYELDKLVHFLLYPDHEDTGFGSSRNPVTGQLHNIERYSTEIVHAWEVFERHNWYLQRGADFYAVYSEEAVNQATSLDGQFTDESNLSCEETAPLAICWAAMFLHYQNLDKNSA